MSEIQEVKEVLTELANDIKQLTKVTIESEMRHQETQNSLNKILAKQEISEVKINQNEKDNALIKKDIANISEKVEKLEIKTKNVNLNEEAIKTHKRIFWLMLTKLVGLVMFIVHLLVKGNTGG